MLSKPLVLFEAQYAMRKAVLTAMQAEVITEDMIAAIEIAGRAVKAATREHRANIYQAVDLLRDNLPGVIKHSVNVMIAKYWPGPEAHEGEAVDLMAALAFRDPDEFRRVAARFHKSPDLVQ